MPLLLTVEMNVANKTNYSDYSPSVSTSFPIFSVYLVRFLHFPLLVFFLNLSVESNPAASSLVGRM